MKIPEQISLINNTTTVLSYSTYVCFIEDFCSEAMDEALGIGNWLVIPTADLPADFSVDTYTIKAGKLIKASAKVIAERKAAATKAYNEAQRLEREAAYRAVTDPKVIELLADNTPEIKALKDEIRAKYPYKA